jgi:diacylglycerol O-acyltransferase / wax synthase
VDQLTTMDAGFLHAGDSDRHANLAIGGLAVVEGPAPDQKSLVSTLAHRIARCPRFAQRLQRRPFDVGAPQWVDDPDFDLCRHVRRIAVPQPGSEHELFELIADVMSWRLDRSRPLWGIG